MPRLPVFNSILIVCLLLMPFTAAAQSISVAWNASLEADVAAYKLYYGPASRHYTSMIMVGQWTEYTFGDLNDMDAVYIAVTAVDTAGNESDYSAELRIELQQVRAQFTLGDAYPNPFNPDTNIPYVLPVDMEIDLRVYDILGRQVAVLRKGLQPAGSYIAEWDGCSSDGRPAAAGIYFIRLRVGGFGLTRRVLLLK